MFSKTIFTLTLMISLLYCGSAFSQVSEFKGDPDVSFATARNLAFNQQRKQAQDTLRLILTKYPDYHDVRNFLANTYAWDGDYKRAKGQYDYVLDKEPANKDAWAGGIQNQLWADAPFKALDMSEEALKLLPNDQDILLLRARAQDNTKKPVEAMETVKQVLKINPENQKAIELKNSLNKSLSMNTVGVVASADFFSDVNDPMQYYTLKFGRQTKYGTITAKWNFNRRFNSNGQQFEVDMYPKITKGLYAYLNAGYSASSLFPTTKYGGELFKSLPKSFEASLGFRALNFDETTWIYTASGGWYSGNSYWLLRTYVTPDDPGTSISGTLSYRLYRADADNYYMISGGIGYSPEINQVSSSALEQVKFNEKSQKLNLGYYFTSPNDLHAFGAQLGITHQEKRFSPGDYYWVFFVGLSWDVRFR